MLVERLASNPGYGLSAEAAMAIAAEPASPAQAGRALCRSLRAHALFIGVVALYVAAALVVPPFFGVTARFSPSLYSTLFIQVNVAFLAVLGAGYAAYVMAVVRPARLARYLWADITRRHVTVERVAQALPVFLLFPLFVSTFTFVKAAVPAMHPFAWDPQLAAWERWLHGGRQPWEWLQPLLGHPYVTAALNDAYHLWFFIAYGVLLWQMLALSRPRLRMRYLLTMLLLWSLLGNVAATVFSSAGPVYFGRVTGLADPFAPLMAYLHRADAAVPVMALEVQDMLWQSYLHRHAGIGAGISAMPSLHVATAFSFALLGFAVDRRLGLAFALFAATILVGSVHLGWHYALDGYVAILATGALWWAVGRLLESPFVVRLLWGRDAPPEG